MTKTIPRHIYQRIVKAKLFIDAHFDEPIGLETMAVAAHLSPFHFHRVFTNVYRITPHQYLTKKRLSRAVSLLDTGAVSVSAVCTGIGFESKASFSHLFRKYHGISPKTYKHLADIRQGRATTDSRHVIPNCFIERG